MGVGGRRPDDVDREARAFCVSRFGSQVDSTGVQPPHPTSFVGKAGRIRPHSGGLEDSLNACNRISAKIGFDHGGDTVSTEAVATRRHAGSHLPATWWKTRNANTQLALAA